MRGIVEATTPVAKGEEALDMIFVAQNYDHKHFYSLSAWKNLRYRALRDMGSTCMLCGASPRTGAVIHVDHIKPRSIFPELAFDMRNLQILCADCNLGKSNRDYSDWRDEEKPKILLRKHR